MHMPAESFDCQISPLTDTASLQTRWQALETVSDSTFFLTWNWMGPWLSLTQSQLFLLEVRQGANDVGLAVLGVAARRRGPLTFQTILLNQSGDPEEDQVFIEYNGILCRKSQTTDVWRSFFDYLISSRAQLPEPLQSWSQLHLPGLEQSASEVGDLITTAKVSRNAHLVDLAEIRTVAGGYLGSLSANTRRQIMRSQRLLAENGEVSFQVATEPGHVQAWLPEMAALQARWFSAKGQRAALSRPFFRAFVEQLVLHNLDSGAVEFIQCKGADGTIGYLINLRSDCQIFSYQSAFAQYDDNKVKPGLVCHAMLAERYSATDADQYNFLVGDSRYKTSLSNAAQSLSWTTLGTRTIKNYCLVELSRWLGR